VENIREPEPLLNYDERKHLETVKNGDLEKYENEYHLVSQSLSLPQKFMELGELEQRMVLLFIDKDYIEANSKKHTENDAFISFLASYENQQVVKKIFKFAQRTVGYDKEGSPITEMYVIVNQDELALYMKLKAHATMIWKQSNLKEISKSMKEIMTNSGYRDEELLEQVILSDSLATDKSAYTMANRRLAVDIKGLKKPMGLQQINVYLDGGGKKANEIISEVTGNKNYQLIPDEPLEIKTDIVGGNNE
jgi:hypothetical protein